MVRWEIRDLHMATEKNTWEIDEHECSIYYNEVYRGDELWDKNIGEWKSWTNAHGFFMKIGAWSEQSSCSIAKMSIVSAPAPDGSG